MTTRIRRSGTPSATPSSLLHGEVALNYADGKLFWKDASNVIQSFTFQAYALSSHTHAASAITSGTLDAARLPLATTIAAGAVIVGTGLGVSSGTVSVTYGTTSGTACQGNDSRLSDARTPTGAAGGDLTGTYPNPQIAAGAVVTADIANDAVTYAKLQNVSATDRLLGRSSAGSGDVEEVTCTAAGRALLSGADAAAQRTTLSVQPTASPAFTGTVSAAAASLTGAVTITRSTSTGAVADIPHIVFNNRNFTNATFVAGGVFSNTYRDVADPHYSAGMWFVRAPFSGNSSSSGDIVFGTGENVAQSAFPTERLRIAASGVSTFSGQLLVTTGSASACGAAFSGDPDTGIAQLSAAGANTLSICTNSAERMRIDANGNVGIGAAPSDRFHVEQSSGIATIILKSAASVAARINFQTTTDGNGYINYDTGAWKFFTNNAGAATERVQIASDGKLYAFNTYGTTVGATNRDLFIDSGGLIGYVSSIRASKTNIAVIDDVAWLRDLTPVSFHYRKRNKDGTYSDEPDGTLDYGLIAEEVEPVAPELCFYDVVDGEPQLRGVHYSKLITPMLRYIQQLEQRIAALEERINA